HRRSLRRGTGSRVLRAIAPAGHARCASDRTPGSVEADLGRLRAAAVGRSARAERGSRAHLGPPTMRRATLWGNLLFWALVVWASVEYILPKWKEFGLSSRLAELEAGWLLGAVLILVAQYLAIFVLWNAVIGVLGGRPNLRALYRAFGLSLLPRYVPGK